MGFYAGCQTIAGVPGADGDVGPSLTHVASRRTLAGLTIPNNVGSLAAWIADPQQFKPGNRMPGNLAGGADLQAIVDYLQTLR